jgi:ribosome-associated protein
VVLCADERGGVIQVTDAISIDENELMFDFVQASGPGGQNVNKVSTAVRLRFDVRNSPSLPEYVREKLEHVAGRRLSSDGVLLIAAQRFRSQLRNREDAIERLVELVRTAAIRHAVRRPTRPTLGSRKRRLEAKGQRSETKRMRGNIPEE